MNSNAVAGYFQAQEEGEITQIFDLEVLM